MISPSDRSIYVRGAVTLALYFFVLSCVLTVFGEYARHLDIVQQQMRMEHAADN